MKAFTLLLIASMAALSASSWADKPHTDIDKVTSLEVHYVTDEPCTNTIAYPTCHTWSNDGKSLFIESSRARPDGTKLPKERQLLKIDIATGAVTHLATLEAEDVKPYGKAQFGVSSQFHFDYAPDANVLTYYDATGHNLYLLDVATGKSKRILHEPEGTIGDPPSISPDGKRVVYYALYRSIGNRFFGGNTSAIFALDVDPVKLEATGEPRIITAFAARAETTQQRRMPDGVIINHCQVNPKDPDHYCYSHQFFSWGDKTPTYTRCWENKRGLDRPIVPSPEAGWQTHELIGPLGKSLYLVEIHDVLAVDLRTRKKRIIFNDRTKKATHITVSPDENWIAADMWDDLKTDKDGCHGSGILLIEAATGKSKLLCRIPRGNVHPRHPHPNFSPDGKKIAFVTAQGETGSQVAYIDITETVRNWDKN